MTMVRFILSVWLLMLTVCLGQQSNYAPSISLGSVPTPGLPVQPANRIPLAGATLAATGTNNTSLWTTNVMIGAHGTNRVDTTGSSLSGANGSFYFVGTTNLNSVACPYYTNASSRWVLFFDGGGLVTSQWTIATNFAEVLTGDAGIFVGDAITTGSGWSDVQGGGRTPPTSFTILPALTVNGNIVVTGSITTGLGTNVVGSSVTNIPLASFDDSTFIQLRMALATGGSYSNFNQGGWTNTLAKINAGLGVKVVRLTQGLGANTDPGFGILEAAVFGLTNRIGPMVGFASIASYPDWRATITGTANYASDHTGLWYPSWITLPAQNDSCTFLSDNATVRGNVGFVIYPVITGAGHLKVETNFNAGSFGTVAANINCDSGAGYTAGITWFTNATVGSFNIRVTQNDSGKALGAVLLAGVIDNTRPGVIVYDLSGNGSDSIDDIAGTNTAFHSMVWSNIQPDLVLMEANGPQDGTSASHPSSASATFTNLYQITDSWRTNANMTPDVVYVGDAPFAAANTVDSRAGNYCLRTNAVRRGFSYCDGYTPFISATVMSNRNYFRPNDYPHLTFAFITNAYDPMLLHWMNFGTRK